MANPPPIMPGWGAAGLGVRAGILASVLPKQLAWMEPRMGVTWEGREEPPPAF